MGKIQDGVPGKIFSDDVLHEWPVSRRCVNICRANNRYSCNKERMSTMFGFVRLDGAAADSHHHYIIFGAGKIPQLGED